MANIEVFQRLADMVVTARARRSKQHDDFLTTFRGIVETVPTEAAKAFGELDSIPLVRDGKEEICGLILSATDYIWWKNRIAAGWRVKLGADKLIRDIAARLGKSAEGIGLEPAERKELIALLEQVSA